MAKGENRIIEAVRVAVNCPLLTTTIEGARGVILNVVGGEDLTFDEVNDAAELVKSVVDASANIIFGARIDPNVQDEVEITVIATGFPGYDGSGSKREDDVQRTYRSNYSQPAYGGSRLSVSEPYYASQQPQQAPQPVPLQQPVRAPQQAQPVQPVQPVQQQVPVQPQYAQQYPQAPQYAQPQQYVQQPAQQVPVQQAQPVQPQQPQQTIERPAEKNVPRFAQLLKNLGRRGE